MAPTHRAAIYPGSFDPITNGHLDLLSRALKAFDEVHLLVAGTSYKSPLMTPQRRVELIKKVLKEEMKKTAHRVQVVHWNGLTTQYARQKKIPFIVRGLRAASDFEHEFMMASMNRQINPNVETLFIMSSESLYFVSSTMIKELYLYGGDISPYVPRAVLLALNQMLKQKGLKP